MNYSQEELHEAAETVVKAHEIQNNKELMNELEPYLKEKMARIDKVLSLKDLWKKGLEEASSKEEEEKSKISSKAYEKDPEEDSVDEKTKVRGERVLAKEDAKIPSKS